MHDSAHALTVEVHHWYSSDPLYVYRVSGLRCSNLLGALRDLMDVIASEAVEEPFDVDMDLEGIEVTGFVDEITHRTG